MAKSVNPIPAQGPIYPYVKICSCTLIYQYEGLLSMFFFIYIYGQGLLSRADLSLCTMLLLTSPTLFCSLAIVFKKTTLFPADRDMWM